MDRTDLQLNETVALNRDLRVLKGTLGGLLSNEYFELKTRVHDKLINIMDLSLIDSVEEVKLRPEIKRLVERILAEEANGVPLNYNEREQFIREIQDEVLGLGPIEPFMKDPTVADILVNTHKQVFVERYGKLESTEARFKDEAHLRRIIDRIVSAVGRRIDESSPMVDERLPDGSRVNAIIPPLAIDGPILSIRRFAADPLELEDLITLKTIISRDWRAHQGNCEGKAQYSNLGWNGNRENDPFKCSLPSLFLRVRGLLPSKTLQSFN